MKTDLQHLPNHKQQELKSIIAALIPRHPEIEMIILFGSYARGNWVEDKYTEQGITYEYKSDYDLLIVMSNNGKANSDTLTQSISGKIEDLNLPTPVHPIFHGIEFVNTELREGNYFFADIKDGGIVLFNTSRYELEDKKDFSPIEAQAKAQKDFANWFESANDFFRISKSELSIDKLKTAAFNLHQATERYYNAIQLVYTGYKSKTHDIEILGKLANSFDLQFSRIFPRATVLERQRFTLLKKAYVDARYNMDYKITKEDLEYLSERVQLLGSLAETICKQKIKSFTE